MGWNKPPTGTTLSMLLTVLNYNYANFPSALQVFEIIINQGSPRLQLWSLIRDWELLAYRSTQSF